MKEIINSGMRYRKYGMLLQVIIFLLCGLMLMPESNAIAGKIGAANNDLSGLSDKKLNWIGLEKLKEKKYFAAEKYFLNAIIKNPVIKYYYNNLSVVYMNQERYSEAYNNLKRAIRIDPKYVKALSNMAITCFYMFHFIESYKYYLAARKADREYTIKRFDKRKAKLRIREIYRKNPGNKNLKRILDHLENNTEK